MYVRITPNVKQKYVLIRSQGTLVLWGNPDVDWHNEIVEELAGAGYDVTGLLGGGWLLSLPEEKVTYVWGKSDRFGKAPIELVGQTLGTHVIEAEPE